MRIPSSSNAVAIALAGLAVVLAASGTAYAVTTSRVTISDSVHPSWRARVDSKGNQKVVGKVSVSGPVTVTAPASTIDIVSSIGFDATIPMSGPTTATLAISSLAYSNPAVNSAFAATSYQVSLVQIVAGSAGTCATGAAGVYTARILGQRYLSPGEDIHMTYPAPLIVPPVPGKKSCIGLTYFHIGGGTQTSLYSSAVQLTGYATKGSYTGVGAAGHAVGPVRTTPELLTR